MRRFVVPLLTFLLGLVIGSHISNDKDRRAKSGPADWLSPGATVNIVPPDRPPVYGLVLADEPPADDEPSHWSIVVFTTRGQQSINLRPNKD